MLSRGRPAAAARPEDLSACRCCRRPTPRRRPAIRTRSAARSRRKVNFDADLSEVALLRGLVAVRPARHLPPQGAAGGDQGDPGRREAARPARRQRAARRSASKLACDAAGRAPKQVAGQGAARRLQGEEGRRRRDCAARRRSRRSGAQGQGQLRHGDRARQRGSARWPARAETASAPRSRSVAAWSIGAALVRRAFLSSSCSCRSRRVFYVAFAERRTAASRLGHFATSCQISLMRESFWNTLYVAGHVGRARHR